MGNRLVVSTAIYTDSIYANELLSINLSFGSHASNNVLRVARVFMAMNRCTERLRALYSNLGTSTPSAPSAKVMWPDPTPDPPLSTDWIEELEFFSKSGPLSGHTDQPGCHRRGQQAACDISREDAN